MGSPALPRLQGIPDHMPGTTITPIPRGSWGREQILWDKSHSCHAKHSAGPCTQPETALLPSLGSPCVPLCAVPTAGPPVLPSCCPGVGGGGAQPHEAALGMEPAFPAATLSRRNTPVQEGIARGRGSALTLALPPGHA